MTVMSDTEMASVTGHGFSKFTLEDGVALAQFDIRASTWTEIDSLKMGYYNDGTALGWDQNWTGVGMGSSSQDMVLKGFFIQADFTNVNDPATRELKSVRIGFRDVTGPMTANFQSFSGDIEGVEINGVPVDGHRLTQPFTQINCKNSEVYLSLEVEGPQKGIWVHFGNGTTVQ